MPVSASLQPMFLLPTAIAQTPRNLDSSPGYQSNPSGFKTLLTSAQVTEILSKLNKEFT